MPPTYSFRAQDVLQERIVVVPEGGQPPTWWLFIFILAGVTVSALVSVWAGFAAATCCARSRNQEDIEKKAARTIEEAEHSRRDSSSTLAVDQDDPFERRLADLLAKHVLSGRGKGKPIRKVSPISLPVNVAELKRWPERSVTNSEPDESNTEPAPNHSSETTIVPESNASHHLGPSLEVARPSYHHDKINADSRVPAMPIDDLCASDEDRSRNEQSRAVDKTQE